MTDLDRVCGTCNYVKLDSRSDFPCNNCTVLLADSGSAVMQNYWKPKDPCGTCVNANVEGRGWVCQACISSLPLNIGAPLNWRLKTEEDGSCVL
jgi:hypothetical protein